MTKQFLTILLCSWAMTGFAADSKDAGTCTKNDKEVKVPGKDAAEMKKNCTEVLKGTWAEKKKQEAGGGGGW